MVDCSGRNATRTPSPELSSTSSLFFRSVQNVFASVNTVSDSDSDDMNSRQQERYADVSPQQQPERPEEPLPAVEMVKVVAPVAPDIESKEADEPQDDSDDEFDEPGPSAAEVRKVMRLHRKGISAVAAVRGPEGGRNLIVSGSEDKDLVVWSLEGGDALAQLKGHTAKISALTIFNEYRYEPLAISGSWDETVQLWPLRLFLKGEGGDTAEEKKEAAIVSDIVSIKLRGHKNRVLSLAVIRADDRLPLVASGSADNRIIIWSLPAGEMKHVLEDRDDMTWPLCMQYYQVPELSAVGGISGPVLITGCKNNTVRIWPLNMREIRISEVTGSSASPRHLLASTSTLFQRAVSGEELVKVSSSSSSAAAATQEHDGAAALAELLAAKEYTTIAHTSKVHGLTAYEYEGAVFIATICREPDVLVWLISGELVKLLKNRSGVPLQAIASVKVPDRDGGAIVVGAGGDGEVRVWFHSTGELFRRFKAHPDSINAISMLPRPAEDDKLAALAAAPASAKKPRAQKVQKLRLRANYILTTGGRDSSVRTWMLNNEKIVETLPHGERVRIGAMGVFADRDTYIVTGTDEGELRGWVVLGEKRKQRCFEMWRNRVHEEAVQSIAAFSPAADGSWMRPGNFLNQPFVLSGDRCGTLVATSIVSGEVLANIEGFDSSPIKVISIFSGYQGTNASSTVAPFAAIGSEDHIVRTVSLVDLQPTHRFEGHSFEINCIAVYMPPTPPQTQPLAQPQLQSLSGGLTEIRDDADRYNTQESDDDGNAAAAVDRLQDKMLVISGSYDGSIRLWSHVQSTMVGRVRCPQSNPTALDVVRLEHEGAAAAPTAATAMLVAADEEAVFHMWSLAEDRPTLLRSVPTGFAEVQAIQCATPDGRGAVLLAGHLDSTVSMWELPQFRRINIIEGHEGEISALRLFKHGKTVPSLATAARDGSVRVLFDYLDFLPDAEMVEDMFRRDMRGVNSFVHRIGQSAATAWPRITSASERYGVDEFFNIYYDLFRRAVLVGRSDFLLEFLPRTRAGLVQSHNTKLMLHQDTLLLAAINADNVHAVRIIMDCWGKMLSVAPPEGAQDIIYDVDYAELNVLLEHTIANYAAEYEKLICSVRPLKVQRRQVSKYCLAANFDSVTRAVTLGRVDDDPNASNKIFYFFPVPYYATGNKLKNFEKVCDATDSASVFDADVGKIVLLYVWGTMGSKAHALGMLFYLVFVTLVSVMLLTFRYWEDTHPAVAICVLFVQLLFDIYYGYQEYLQYCHDNTWYFQQIWNYCDIFVVVGNAVGVLMRLILQRETAVSKVVLSCNIVIVWFNILQYLRAYEATGPLVAMILKISFDIRYLCLVMLVCIMGFSQSFWILTQDDREIVFSDFGQSLLTSYSFMLGNFDPSLYMGSELEDMMSIMTVLYMLVLSILLLNLIIAMMGDSFAKVQGKGLAQWRLELAKICYESTSSLFLRGRLVQMKYKDADVIYVHLDPNSELTFLAPYEQAGAAAATAAAGAVTEVDAAMKDSTSAADVSRRDVCASGRPSAVAAGAGVNDSSSAEMAVTLDTAVLERRIERLINKKFAALSDRLLDQLPSVVDSSLQEALASGEY